MEHNYHHDFPNQAIDFTFLEGEEDAALTAASDEAGNFREYLERKLGVKPVDAVWAFAIYLKFSPSFLEDNSHVVEDMRAILAKKNLLHQKVENRTNN
jgi:hypothetical protein